MNKTFSSLTKIASMRYGHFLCCGYKKYRVIYAYCVFFVAKTNTHSLKIVIVCRKYMVCKVIKMNRLRKLI